METSVQKVGCNKHLVRDIVLIVYALVMHPEYQVKMEASRQLH